VWNEELTLVWWEAVALMLVAVATTAGAAAVVLRRAVLRRAAPVSAVGSHRPAGAPADSRPAEAGTDVLTEGLIGAFDLAGSSPAVRAHVQQVLRRAGVVPLDVTPGAPFDPAAHLAVETEQGPPDRWDRVARQVRVGWTSHGAVVRPAEVVVWTRS
jgi:hypothetical protein